ncbi:hypothetical protein H0A36_25805 [Endozoicomonas sp. SM1973]|uniref:Uncharacterized protein n=1 Tax=Spartinivicinus marinus TaxID=2994442 RepID=A0A853IK29_9GAMM|nr:hypothetical protein [Spartinivicinus marinus]MCX4030281.1 hypothetical protein [Spartinivicinus marinus]MCX4030416.1 hypothetical protein [Spartinivicinus marinus]NYZ69435.1 hypothetical protein [Spartinivicinus marinus]
MLNKAIFIIGTLLFSGCLLQFWQVKDLKNTQQLLVNKNQQLVNQLSESQAANHQLLQSLNQQRQIAKERAANLDTIQQQLNRALATIKAHDKTTWNTQQLPDYVVRLFTDHP